MKTFSHKPTLIDGDLILRPYKTDDFERMFTIIENKEVKYLTGSVINSEELDKTGDKEHVLMWYESLNERNDRLDLILEFKGEVLGELVLNEWDDEMASCNFRILMDPHHTSQGIGSRAMSLFLDYAFKNLPINRIELEVYEFNPRAKRAYEKVGFVYEGCKRKAFRMDNTYYDIYLYAMLRDDFSL